MGKRTAGTSCRSLPACGTHGRGCIQRRIPAGMNRGLRRCGVAGERDRRARIGLGAGVPEQGVVTAYRNDGDRPGDRVVGRFPACKRGAVGPCALRLTPPWGMPSRAGSSVRGAPGEPAATRSSFGRGTALSTSRCQSAAMAVAASSDRMRFTRIVACRPGELPCWLAAKIELS